MGEEVFGLHNRPFTVATVKTEFAPGYPSVLKIDDVAEILRVSRPTAYELARRNDFPTMRIGRRMLVSKEALAEWVRNQSKRSEL